VSTAVDMVLWICSWTGNMGRRGPGSIVEQILMDKRFSTFSECYELDRPVSVKLKDCLREINRQ